MGKKYRYIPKSSLRKRKKLQSVVNDGDIIAILTSKKGLDTSHLGIAVWHDDGLHLLNASFVEEKSENGRRKSVVLLVYGCEQIKYRY